VAVVPTLTKGYDLDYIWKQVDRGPAKDAASYYIQASKTGGEPPGRWWGPDAGALGFEANRVLQQRRLAHPRLTAHHQGRRMCCEAHARPA
jgi:hypothetical protein